MTGLYSGGSQPTAKEPNPIAGAGDKTPKMCLHGAGPAGPGGGDTETGIADTTPCWSGLSRHWAGIRFSLAPAWFCVSFWSLFRFLEPSLKIFMIFCTYSKHWYYLGYRLA